MLPTGSIRKTGRVAADSFSTHFQSSLIKAPSPGLAYTSSMELKTLARSTYNKLCMPGCTAIFCFTAGTKLASDTRTE